MVVRRFFVFLLPLACGPTAPVPTSADGGSTSDATSSTGGGTLATTTSGVSTGRTSTGIADDSTGLGSDSTGLPPDFEEGQECDIFLQDCPRGYKCIVYNEKGPGGLGNAWGCFPVSDEPVGLGEPCTAIDGVGSGLDDCPAGAACWGGDYSETGEGHCVSYCTGDFSNPVCEDPDTFCHVPGDASIGAWCFPVCAPLGGDCPEGQTCISSDNYTFSCVTDASGRGGAVGDPCEFINACDPGLRCTPAELVPNCTSLSCCSAYCTVGEDSGCAPGQTCEPFYDEGPPPHPSWKDVGVCVLPGA